MNNRERCIELWTTKNVERINRMVMLKPRKK